MAIYSYLFGLILACVSYIVYQRYTNAYTSVVNKPLKRYDYIIGKCTLFLVKAPDKI